MQRTEGSYARKNLADSKKDAQRSLRLAMRHLSDRERELLTMKVKVGMDAEKLADALNFSSERELKQAYDRVIKVVRIYVEYFLNNDHQIVTKFAGANLADEGKLLFSLFHGDHLPDAGTITGAGRECNPLKQIENDLRIMAGSGVPECKRYGETIKKLMDHKRL